MRMDCASSSVALGKLVGGGLRFGYLWPMHARIEKMGDGFGLRLPKRLLDTCGLGEEVSVTVHDKTLVIGPAPTGARTGWTEAIQNIPQKALDRDYEELQAFREMPEEWDAHGWQWPEIGRAHV